MRWPIAVLRYARDIGQTVEAVVLVLFARFLVTFLPFRVWRPLMGRIASYPVLSPVGDAVMRRARRFGDKVTHVADRLPLRLVCLPRAMAAQLMMGRRGIPSALVIGAAPRAMPGRFPSLHAWLEVGGLPVIGGAEAQQHRASFCVVRIPRRYVLSE